MVINNNNIDNSNFSFVKKIVSLQIIKEIGATIR